MRCTSTDWAHSGWAWVPGSDLWHGRSAVGFVLNLKVPFAGEIQSTRECATTRPQTGEDGISRNSPKIQKMTVFGRDELP
jgi:hypothetical protein